MEIDKKIILRLVQALEDLKKSLKETDIYTKDNSIEETNQIIGTEKNGNDQKEIEKMIKNNDPIDTFIYEDER